jgi:tyrosine-protein kinase Etk/Wzc
MVPENHRVVAPEDSDIRRLWDLVAGNYKVFLFSIMVALAVAYAINKYSVPVYRVSASLLIKESPHSAQNSNMNDYLNSNIFGINQNFQNELWVVKSSPVIEQTIRNLGLSIGYCRKSGFQQLEAYSDIPFKVVLLSHHVQPLNEWFYISIKDSSHFHIRVSSKRATFRVPDQHGFTYQKEKWAFERNARFGELIQTDDLAFIVKLNRANLRQLNTDVDYGFIISEASSLTSAYKQQLEFNIVERDATIVEIALKSSSVVKAQDILNELMAVYSQQNLERKNHIANVTIAYIDSQLDEISDSLNQTEQDLQQFRSSSQLLNVTSQSNELSAQYRELQNQKAELLTNKRYYDYLGDYLSNNEEDYSELILPSSMGIQDQVLNNLMSELISAHAQRSNLIQNRQERNPLVQRLAIQIENFRKTISENVTAVRHASEMSIDEMDKRIQSIESEIARLPRNEQRLGGIQREFRLNDAIYNYLLEKRAEAKISQASNLPDNLVIEPAKMVGSGPFFPNRRKNYLFAFVLGFAIPFGTLLLKSILNNKLEALDNVVHLTDAPVLGKISHHVRNGSNVMAGFPNSDIAESYRALRTNIEFYFRDLSRKSILVTSCLEGEGKTFTALNLAVCYAQLNRKTILVNVDLRKSTHYFPKDEMPLLGLSDFLSGLADLDAIIGTSSQVNLDFLPSGSLPPNPVELIAQGNIHELIQRLKERYDCVILDSTPLTQVSDAYLYINDVDIVLVVARFNYTLKRMFAMVMEELKHRGVSNACVVLNDSRLNSDHYGYGYKKRGRGMKGFRNWVTGVKG